MTNQTITREELRLMHRPPGPATVEELEALDRLLAVAEGDSGGSRRVADFLLAWWNAGTCGGFDLTDLWGLDLALREDVVAVFGLIARRHEYPNNLGVSVERRFGALVASWRPDLVNGHA